jgi:hypothetical protein
MDPVKEFDQALTKAERKVIARLTSPARIQAFLDDVPYSDEERYRCPLTVLRDNKAHCFDGALFAAALLRRIGYPPVIVDLLAVRDDDHVLAIYKRDGLWGAVAKSNFSGLRFREAIHRNLRELVLSYFDDYFNVEGTKTLRTYTAPLSLRKMDDTRWMVSDERLDDIGVTLGQIPVRTLVTREAAKHFSPVDKRSYQAGMLGVNEAGLYKPSGKAPKRDR